MYILRRCLGALGLFVFVMGWLPSPAAAATLMVPGRYATIQAAVNAAANGDTVLIADGTYTGSGDVDIDYAGKSLTVTSQHGAAKTIIDCAGSSGENHRGFFFHSFEANAVVSGLTIKNGYMGSGGAVDIEGSNVTLQNCILTANTATSAGGGAIFSNNGAFLDNTAGGSLYSGSVTIENCAIAGNTAPIGGGIYENFYGVMTLKGCAIQGNTATSASYSSGGGLYNVGALTMTGCTISGNASLYGGGVFNKISGGNIVTLADCTLTNNTASDYGGGIENANLGSISNSYQGGTILMIHCAVTKNTAPNGGGVYDTDQADGATTLADCTISGNTATPSGYGGGVYNDHLAHGTGAIALSHCVITGNAASDGGTGYGGRAGGVYNGNANNSTDAGSGGTITLTGCTISANTALFASGGVENNNSSAAGGDRIALTACAVTGNRSGVSGGGVSNYNADSHSGGTIALTNCTLSANTAYDANDGIGTGGGVYNQNSDGLSAIMLTNCTLTGNTAKFSDIGGGGGGIYNNNASTGSASDQSVILLTNDILYGDMGGEVTDVAQTVSDAVFCDIQGNSGTPAKPDAGHNFSADPLFVNASTDLHLRSGSPCLSSGTRTGAPALDKDGAARGTPPGIGAFTLPGSMATILSLFSASNPSPADQSVVITALVLPAGLTNPPGGTVQFAVDGSPVGSPVSLDSIGRAAFTTSSLPLGAHTITAAYSHTGAFLDSLGSFTQTVIAAQTAQTQILWNHRIGWASQCVDRQPARRIYQRTLWPL